MSPKRSIVWEFFNKKDNTVSVCGICDKEIRFHGSTRNLMDHVKRKHHQYLQMYTVDGALEEQSGEVVYSITVDTVKNDDDTEIQSFIIQDTSKDTSGLAKRKSVVTTGKKNRKKNLAKNNGPRKRSIVWGFYTKKDSTVSVCNICHAEIRFHGSTRNLMDHVKRKHHQYLQTYTVDDALEEKSSEVVICASEDTANNKDEMELTSFTTPGISGLDASKSVIITEKNQRLNKSKYKMSCKQPGRTTTRTPKKSSSIAVPWKKSCEKSITGTMQLELSKGKIKEIDSLLIDTIAEGYLPFSLVENKSFIKLVNVLEPRYKLPNRKTLTNELISDYYLDIRNNIIRKLQESKYVALTAEMWISINTEGFLSLTAHFVQGGKLHTAVLATKQIKECHTENIACNIKSIIDEWEISKKVVALVTDNASVMADVANKLGIVHLDCAAHNLNSVVSDIMSDPTLEDLALIKQKCKKIVTFFKNSTIGSSKLVACQEQLGIAPIKLKQEVTSRWNSTYIMMQRLVEVKEALIMTLSQVSCSESLTATEWDILIDCIEIMEPLFELTEEMSGEGYATSSIVIPLVKSCQEAVRAVNPSTMTGIELQSQLLFALSRRMSSYETDTSGICAKATILDPRFKTYGFGQSSNATVTANEIISEVELINKSISDGIDLETIQSAGADLTGNEGRKKKKIWKYFLEEKERLGVVKTSISPAKEEMQFYLSQSLIDMENNETDPFTYWKKYEDSLKALSSIAYKYLCVPAMSVPSERVFSKKGEVYSELRNGLKATIVDKMVFLNANHKFKHE